MRTQRLQVARTLQPVMDGDAVNRALKFRPLTTLENPPTNADEPPSLLYNPMNSVNMLLSHIQAGSLVGR
jgi:hypothetical protein